MKVFISWSGETSRAVALALADWFPKVIQVIQPFVSAKDIDKGANWTVELARELEEAAFGVVCLAPDNIQSPWLYYETGAITKSVDSRVCPVLFGLQKAEIPAPMSQLQMTTLEKEDVLALMKSMNKVAGSPINEVTLIDAVDVWWPQLEKNISAIPPISLNEQPNLTVEPKKPTVDLVDMMTELLQRVRNLDEIARMERNERIHRPVMSNRSVGTLRSRRIRSKMEILLESLSAEGALVQDIASDSATGVIRLMEDLPESATRNIFRQMHDLALEERIILTLASPNREYVFDKDGIHEEPPF